jgi:hypothetical protein
MKTRILTLPVILTAAFTLLFILQIHSQTLFKDDFESGSLAQWSGKGGAQHHGTIVNDPLSSTNHVLTFTAIETGGDIYSTVIGTNALATGGVLLSFDFLALPKSAFPPPEYGGFIGIDTEPGEYYWLAGTYLGALSLPPPSQVLLVTDGLWHHYEMDLTQVLALTNAASFQVVLEDWAERGSTPGDVFFDNIEVISGFAVDIRVSQVEICWHATLNATYQLEFQSALTANKWVSLGEQITGNGARFCTNDVVPLGEPRRFYRITTISP